MGIEIQPPGTPAGSIGALAGVTPVEALPGTPVSATAAVNTAVVITIAHNILNSTRLKTLSWSYNAAPTGGLVTVVVNAVTILQLDITAAGPGFVDLGAAGLECANNFDVVITLAAAGAAVAGRLNVSSIFGS